MMEATGDRGEQPAPGPPSHLPLSAAKPGPKRTRQGSKPPRQEADGGKRQRRRAHLYACGGTRTDSLRPNRPSRGFGLFPQHVGFQPGRIAERPTHARRCRREGGPRWDCGIRQFCFSGDQTISDEPQAPGHIQDPGWTNLERLPPTQAHGRRSGDLLPCGAIVCRVWNPYSLTRVPISCHVLLNRRVSLT